jgi:GntR family transcriptional regulator / MocR family aminotransferase
MSITWANLGVDLHLDPVGRRVRAGLEHSLRDAIQTGQLHPGARLPSSRALALDLGVARNTVAEAYGQLVAEGWLAARQGSGTRVADRPAITTVAPARDVPGAGRIRYDLRPGRPDLAMFPRAAWLAAARRALTAAPYDALGYGDPRGRPELRAALAEYLSRVRGVRATADRIVVCTGFVQALGLLFQVRRAGGRQRLAMEAYGLLDHRRVAAASGLQVRTLPIDAAGADVAGIDGVDTLLLTPAHQFPLGMPLAPDRRRQVVEWAIEGDGLVIEDDYDGEFRYDRQAVGAMQALAPEHVVYAGTASKALAPGLRLAWLVLPPHLIEPVVEAKRLADGHSGTIDQLALAELIVSGAYDRHVRRCRLAYQRRRDRLVATLGDRVPGARVTGIAAGLHAVVELPDGRSEDEVVASAAGHQLAVEGLDSYRAAVHRHRSALVIGYATPPEHAFTAALTRLCTILAEPAAAG